MTTEQKRMYQRRGLKQNLPTSPETGEIYLTVDTEEVFVGVNNKNLKAITTKDVVDNLTTNNDTLPVSAKQAMTLKGQIDSLSSSIISYTNQTNDIVNGMQSSVQQNTSNISTLQNNVNQMQNSINNKQEIVMHKGTSPSTTDATLMWCDTN